jgi:hypothetical protein
VLRIIHTPERGVLLLAQADAPDHVLTDWRLENPVPFGLQRRGHLVAFAAGAGVIR